MRIERDKSALFEVGSTLQPNFTDKLYSLSFPNEILPRTVLKFYEEKGKIRGEKRDLSIKEVRAKLSTLKIYKTEKRDLAQNLKAAYDEYRDKSVQSCQQNEPYAGCSDAIDIRSLDDFIVKGVWEGSDPYEATLAKAGYMNYANFERQLLTQLNYN